MLLGELINRCRCREKVFIMGYFFKYKILMLYYLK